MICERCRCVITDGIVIESPNKKLYHDGTNLCLDALKSALAAARHERDNWHQLVKDHCDEDTYIRNTTRPILGEKDTDGDSYGVPMLSDIVDCLVATIANLRTENAKLL